MSLKCTMDQGGPRSEGSRLRCALNVHITRPLSSSQRTRANEKSRAHTFLTHSHFRGRARSRPMDRSSKRSLEPRVLLQHFLKVNNLHFVLVMCTNFTERKRERGPVLLNIAQAEASAGGDVPHS